MKNTVKVPGKYNKIGNANEMHYLDECTLTFYCSAKFSWSSCKDRHYHKNGGCWTCSKCMIVACRLSGHEFVLKSEAQTVTVGG